MRLLLVVLLAAACQGDKPAPPKPAPAPAPPPKPVDPFADERDRMVRDTIERDTPDHPGVRDEHVLAAMRSVPRHEFVPPKIRARAYEDAPQQIGFGLTISQPYIVALMSEAAHVSTGNRVLEIGTGSGYQAAVLAAMGCEVYTIEINEGLGKRTAEVLANLGLDKIHTQIGDGYFGWAQASPFDAILVTTAAPRVPPPLIQQLKIGGRIVMPVGDQNEQSLEVLTRGPDGMTSRELIPVIFSQMIGEVRRTP